MSYLEYLVDLGTWVVWLTALHPPLFMAKIYWFYFCVIYSKDGYGWVYVALCFPDSSKDMLQIPVSSLSRVDSVL